MRKVIQRLFWLLSAAAISLLTGCASVRVIDSEVVSVAAAPPGMSLQGAQYRFERLPSQVNNPDAGLAEQQAQVALAAVGLVRDDAGAQLSVLVSFSGTQYLVDPWGRPLPPGWMSHGNVFMGSNLRPRVGLGVGMDMHFPPITHYYREVGLIMRDLKTGQVVYETRASHQGPWRDNAILFATLFQAALSHFPSPPAGLRRVNIEVPR